MGIQTDFLIARPSFWSGVGRLLDLWGVFDEYNESSNPAEADRRALYADWSVTGRDLRDALGQFEEREASRQGELFSATAA